MVQNKRADRPGNDHGIFLLNPGFLVSSINFTLFSNKILVLYLIGVDILKQVFYLLSQAKQKIDELINKLGDTTGMKI